MQCDFSHITIDIRATVQVLLCSLIAALHTDSSVTSFSNNSPHHSCTSLQSLSSHCHVFACCRIESSQHSSILQLQSSRLALAATHAHSTDSIDSVNMSAPASSTDKPSHDSSSAQRQSNHHNRSAIPLSKIINKARRFDATASRQAAFYAKSKQYNKVQKLLKHQQPMQMEEESPFDRLHKQTTSSTADSAALNDDTHESDEKSNDDQDEPLPLPLQNEAADQHASIHFNHRQPMQQQVAPTIEPSDQPTEKGKGSQQQQRKKRKLAAAAEESKRQKLSKQEFAQKQAERQHMIQQSHQRRNAVKQSVTQRTKKGQPILANLIQAMLPKLEKQAQQRQQARTQQH